MKIHIFELESHSHIRNTFNNIIGIFILIGLFAGVHFGLSYLMKFLF